jgi:hypothetical protein
MPRLLLMACVALLVSTPANAARYLIFSFTDFYHTQLNVIVDTATPGGLGVSGSGYDANVFLTNDPTSFDYISIFGAPCCILHKIERVLDPESGVTFPSTTDLSPSSFDFTLHGVNGWWGVDYLYGCYHLICGFGEIGGTFNTLRIIGTDVPQTPGVTDAPLYAAPAPEPATWLTLLTGLAVIGYGVRRRGNSQGCSPDNTLAS